MSVGRTHVGVHRISWIIHKGPIPNALCVLHRCDNPPCVNPDHLFLGTQLDNIQDCIEKGRSRRNYRLGKGRSGVPYVSWVSKVSKWRVLIPRVGGGQKMIGEFDALGEAKRLSDAFVAGEIPLAQAR